jgi:hypothetical protein
MMHNCLQTIPLFVYLITNPDSTVQYSISVQIPRSSIEDLQQYRGRQKKGERKEMEKGKKKGKKEKKGENKSQSEILETGEPEILTTTDKRKQQAIPCPHAARN